VGLSLSIGKGASEEELKPVEPAIGFIIVKVTEKIQRVMGISGLVTGQAKNRFLGRASAYLNLGMSSCGFPWRTIHWTLLLAVGGVQPLD
jgi:hypothetical protein